MSKNGPLDYQALLSEELGRDLPPWERLSAGTRVGHVHLHVADLAATRRFYHGMLGFEVPMNLEPYGGAFFAAGGYHHHIGTNIWHGAGAPPPPADATGLRHFTVVLPNGDELARLVARAEQAGHAVVTTDEGVLVRDPADPDDDGLLAAVREAVRLLPFPPAPSGPGPLALAEAFLLACADDLVVLRRRGPGRLTAELLAVAFPSGWPPRLRAGADLAALHAPVADGARLRAASGALSEALLTKGPFAQHVWGLDPDGRLDRDPSAPDAAAHGCPAPERWWLRVERQTSLPLPHLDRALFLIRPHLVPLTSLLPAQRRAVHDAVASMSPQALAYKGLTEVRDDLLAWLRALGARGKSGAMATINPIQLQKYLKGAEYPLGKDELVSLAESNGADDNAMEALRAIEDRQYDGPNAVSHELKQADQT